MTFSKRILTKEAKDKVFLCRISFREVQATTFKKQLALRGNIEFEKYLCVPTKVSKSIILLVTVMYPAGFFCKRYTALDSLFRYHERTSLGVTLKTIS